MISNLTKAAGLLLNCLHCSFYNLIIAFIIGHPSLFNKSLQNVIDKSSFRIFFKRLFSTKNGFNTFY